MDHPQRKTTTTTRDYNYNFFCAGGGATGPDTPHAPGKIENNL